VCSSGTRYLYSVDTLNDILWLLERSSRSRDTRALQRLWAPATPAPVVPANATYAVKEQYEESYSSIRQPYAVRLSSQDAQIRADDTPDALCV